MAKETNMRTLVKESTISGGIPTIPGSGATNPYDHEAGGWTDFDIYDTELMCNTTDKKIWVRLGDEIVRLGYSGETQYSTDLDDMPSSLVRHDGEYITVSGTSYVFTSPVFYSTIQSMEDWSYGAIGTGNTGQSVVVDATGTGFTVSSLNQAISGLTDVSGASAYTQNYILVANGSQFVLADPASTLVTNSDNQLVGGDKYFTGSTYYTENINIANGFIFTGITDVTTITDIDNSSGMTAINQHTLATTKSIYDYINTIIFGTGDTANFVTTDTVQTITGVKTFGTVNFSSGITASDMNISADLTVTGNTYNDLTSYNYFGDATTDGSYRTYINPTGQLEIQYRSSGVWEWATNYGSDGIRAQRITITTGSTIDAPYFDSIQTGTTLDYNQNGLASEYSIRSYFDTIFVSAGTIWQVVDTTVETVTGGLGLTIDAGISAATFNLNSTSDMSGVTSTSALTQDYNVLSTEGHVKDYVDAQISSEDFWDRTGTVLSPSNTGDGILTTGGISGGSATIGTRLGAIGTNSFAQGNNNEASGRFSHAEGFVSIASGDLSHAEGGSTASGNSSHAEGYRTSASGLQSHSEGSITKAIGDYSHAEGQLTEASGTGSHSQNIYTRAAGDSSHAGGTGSFGLPARYVIADGIASFNHSFISASGIDGAVGNYSAILGGENNEVNGVGAVIFGGNGNVIDGNYAVGGGYSNTADGTSALVQGRDSQADGEYAIALGRTAVVNADYGAAIGGRTNTVNHNDSVILGGSNITTQAINTVSVPQLDFSGTGTVATSITSSSALTQDYNVLATEGHVKDYTDSLLGAISTSYFALPAWDMDAGAVSNVPHTISANTIIEITALIYNDSGGSFLPLLNDGSITASDSSATLVRGTSFDDAAFSGSSASRGYLVIKYI